MYCEMRLNEVSSLLAKATTVSSRVVNIVGVAVLLVIVLITVVDVITRGLFNQPVLGVLVR